MSNRKTPLVINEHYHIFNRGVDKRAIFQDKTDLDRFFASMQIFNSIKPIGSIFESNFPTWRLNRQVATPLVEIIAYCLNLNHFHLILKQVAENGITEYMKRLSGGYTWYFNNKYKRNGSLFQGTFKSIHIDSDEYLLHLSVYVNLNNKLNGEIIPLSKSSWGEYVLNDICICNPKIILDRYTNKNDYSKFAKSSFENILMTKNQEKELQGFL